MSERSVRPAWGWLLPIPVLGFVFVLYIQGLHLSAAMFDVLAILGLVMIGGYLEVWRHANRYALLHITAADGTVLPLYEAREAVPAQPAAHRAIGASRSGMPGRRLVPPREYVAPPVAVMAGAPAAELLE